MRVARRQCRSVGPDRAALAWVACVKAALGGRRRVRRAAGQRGAAGHTRRAYRPHVRWAPARRPAAHARRPTALAADTAGAAPNLGVVYARRRVPMRASVHQPASGAAEAGRWAA